MKTLSNKKLNNGITLIALVITIIVLLILAGVAISTLTGENGILTKVNDAKIESEKAEAREKIQLEMAASVDNTGKFDRDKAIENLEKNLGLTVSRGAVTKNADGTLTVKLNGYEFKVYENGKVDKGTAIGEDNKQEDNNLPETEEVGAWTKLNKVSKTGGFDSSKGVNAPKLGSELTAVTLTTDVSDYTTNGTWYNYEAQTGTTESGGTSKWANAVTTDTDGSITGYYVWIPRYAYKITKGYHGAGLTYTDNRTTEAGTIEVKFLKGTTNEFADGTGTAETNPANITYTDGVQDQWLVHPAFLSDASIGGGFGSKSGSNDGITGIWVAKFEISAVIDEADKSSRQIGEISTEQQIKLRVLPGVQSSSIKNIGTMYEFAYNMNRTSDSHMLKNSEWGAVAYLAHSKYGRNGTEIAINNTYYEGEGPRGDTYTGGSNTETGYLSNGIQSTTGNAYGIYDINGGKGEYVAAYVNNGNSNLTNYGGTLYTTTDMKYKNVYTKSSSGDIADNYSLSENIKGDAVYETSNIGNSNSSWHSDYSSFPYSDYPFFGRGGYGYNGSDAGTFFFDYSNGYADLSISFRSCLVVG